MSKLSKKGFTLIELLIVIAIVGILASIFLSRCGARREAFGQEPEYTKPDGVPPFDGDGKPGQGPPGGTPPGQDGKDGPPGEPADLSGVEVELKLYREEVLKLKKLNMYLNSMILSHHTSNIDFTEDGETIRPTYIEEIIKDSEYYSTANIHISPINESYKLRPGEVKEILISLTADKPVQVYLTSNSPHIRLDKNFVFIQRADDVLGQVSYAKAIITMPKYTYWHTGYIDCVSVDGKVLTSSKITIENEGAWDHKSSVSLNKMGNNGKFYNTLTHSFSCDRGNYGYGFTGYVSHDREDGETLIGGTLDFDW